MKDEGLGLAGWLLADLVLVLAVLFLAIVPGDPEAEPHVAPEWGDVVLAEMRRDTFFNGPLAATGHPDPKFEIVAGALPPGIEIDPRRGDLAGIPTTVGDYEFTVRAWNDAGEAWLALSSRVKPPADECSAVAEFAFDQIILPTATVGRITDQILAEGYVRTALTKDQELHEVSDNALRVLPRAEEFLDQRQQDRYQIALIETFGGELAPSTAIAKDVNERLSQWLARRFPAHGERESILYYDTEYQEWTANYLTERVALRDSARVNLYFVKAPPPECF